MKAFFQYLVVQNYVNQNVTDGLKAPKLEKKAPVILSMEETSRLLDQPNGNTPKELRDHAMLELLYATGIRVSELISLKLSDINLKLEYVTCRDAHKERIIPFGEAAKEALQHYLEAVSYTHLVNSSDSFFFLMILSHCILLFSYRFFLITCFSYKKISVQKAFTLRTLIS